MAKNEAKYYFDPTTLSYKKVKVRLSQRVKKFVIWLITTGTLWVLIYFVIARFLPTPREFALKRDLDNLLLNYEVLQKQIEENEKVLSAIENRDDNLYRVVFESEPLPKERRYGLLSNKEKFNDLQGYKYSELIINSTKRVEEFTKRLYAQSKSLDEVVDLAKQKEELLRSIPAICPVSMRDANIEGVSGFGRRLHPISKVWRMHEGMDFGAKIGTPVYATGEGKVIFSGYNSGGYGNCVVIDHGFGFQTRYAHLHAIKVFKGKKIARGEVIGTVGNTGLSKGPHLHYEVMRKGVKVDPINYYYKDLTLEEYNELLARASELTAPYD